MTVNLSSLAGAGQQFFDNNGVPLSGGKLHSYEAGTTTTQTTYTTAAGNVAHANPIILDSAGRVSTGEIWLTAGSNYKFVLKTSADVTLATWDNITGINGTGIATNAEFVDYVPSGTGAVATTVQSKLREVVSILDFGADPAGASSSSAAIINAQDYLASIGGGTLFFPPGEYKVTTPIPMKPGITYCGPMKAGLSSYNPNRSRIFRSTGDIFTNAATAITEVACRDLYIESESGGGHVFDWSSAGLVAKIEMSGVCFAQRNASKCVIYGVAAGGVFSIWLHDFEYVYVPACLYPPIWLASTTVNSIVIENFWSTANGQSAVGNPSIWIESTNPGGAAFNVTVRQGVFELPGSGSVIFKSVANGTIEDCTIYDLSITPGYYQFAFMKGPSGPASNNCSIRRCRSTVGTAGVPDLFIDASVAGQSDFIVEQSTFSYVDGSVSSAGSKVILLHSGITNKANLPYLELGSAEQQVHFGSTAGTSADVSFWNGYPGNRDGSLNVTVNGTHSGSISKTGVFSWGNAYILQSGVINAGAHMYPGTPAGAQQANAGLLAGTGAPNNANGNNGDFYFRSDGGSGTSIYMKRAGAWVGII